LAPLWLWLQQQVLRRSQRSCIKHFRRISCFLENGRGIRAIFNSEAEAAKGGSLCQINRPSVLLGIRIIRQDFFLFFPSAIPIYTVAVFSSDIFGGNIHVALSLLFGKIYPTMN
jgi:hypothetical protein